MKPDIPLMPEQVDPNLICDMVSPTGFAFPPRSAFALNHLLARANAQNASEYVCIVIGFDKSNGDKFVSTNVDTLDTATALRLLLMELMASLARGETPQGMDDANPDSSPRSE